MRLDRAQKTANRLYHRYRPFKRTSKSRRESNDWLRRHATDVGGKVLSIGSQNDRDREGGHYRDYFPAADSYTTSEVSRDFGCDLMIDVRNMPEIPDGSYDAIYCSGVLEHVDDYLAALGEMTRVLAPGGILLLGLPFRQAIHNAPLDYWRFTEGGIRHLLKDDYDILRLDPIDDSVKNFPAAYWCKARKRG